MVDIGDLPGGDDFTRANAASKDGTTVVGQSRSTSGNQAFRWTQARGMVGLGDLPGGSFSSIARDVSEDGSVVVGFSQSDNGKEAFRWTVEGGMQTLPGVPAGSEAWGVSSDGKVVVGEYISGGDRAFVWDPVREFQDVTTLLLAQNSMVFQDWSGPLQQALAISDDGTVLQAMGTSAVSGFQDVVVVAFRCQSPRASCAAPLRWPRWPS